MSRFLTPSEPVARDSGQNPLPSGRFLKTLASACLWFIQNFTIILGWFYPHFASFFPSKANQLFSTQSTPQSFSQVGYSHRQYIYKISLFPLLSFCCFFVQIAYAAPPDQATTPTRLVIPSVKLDSRIVPVGVKKVELDGQIYKQWDVDD